ARVRVRRLLAVLVVLEARLLVVRRTQEDRADVAGVDLVAVVVPDLDVPFGNLADGARLREPLVRLDGRSRTFGRRVVLPDDRSDPVDHRLLHVHRTRRRTVRDP